MKFISLIVSARPEFKLFLSNSLLPAEQPPVFGGGAAGETIANILGQIKFSLN
jgi:hypothetical protein